MDAIDMKYLFSGMEGNVRTLRREIKERDEEIARLTRENAKLDMIDKKLMPEWLEAERQLDTIADLWDGIPDMATETDELVEIERILDPRIKRIREIKKLAEVLS